MRCKIDGTAGRKIVWRGSAYTLLEDVTFERGEKPNPECPEHLTLSAPVALDGASQKDVAYEALWSMYDFDLLDWADLQEHLDGIIDTEIEEDAL